MKNLFVLLAILTLSVACEAKKKSSPQDKGSDSVTYDLKLELNEKVSTPDDVKQLVADINAGKNVSFDFVTNLLIRENSDLFATRDIEAKGMQRASREEKVNLFKTARAEHETYISKLVSSVRSKDYLSQKSQYESKVETLNGQTLVYNKQYNTTMDIQKHSKMQCDSGTNLNLIISRKATKGSLYRKDNRVVILSPSHVQPGQIKEFADSKHLISIETTQSGDAVIYEGKTSDLRGCKKIVDADSYALVDALSRYLTTENQKALVAQITKATAEKHGINNESLEKSCEEQSYSNRGSDTQDSKKQDNDLFSVSATRPIPSGDTQRPATQDDSGSVSSLNTLIAQKTKAHQDQLAQAKAASINGGNMGTPIPQYGSQYYPQYGGILAPGTLLSAKECNSLAERMAIPTAELDRLEPYYDEIENSGVKINCEIRQTIVSVNRKLLGYFIQQRTVQDGKSAKTTFLILDRVELLNSADNPDLIQKYVETNNTIFEAQYGNRRVYTAFGTFRDNPSQDVSVKISVKGDYLNIRFSDEYNTQFADVLFYFTDGSGYNYYNGH